MVVDIPARTRVLSEDDIFKVLGRFVASKIQRYVPDQVLGAYAWSVEKEGAPFTAFVLFVTPKTLELLSVETSTHQWGGEPQIVESDFVRVSDIERLNVIWKTREGVYSESEFLNDILQECRCRVALSKPLGELGTEFSLPVAEEIEGNASAERINGKVHAVVQALRVAVSHSAAWEPLV